MPGERPEDTRSDADKLVDANRQLEVLADDLTVMLGRQRARTAELDAALRELREAYMHTARALALLVEGNDADTRTHLDRTLRWATHLATKLGMSDLEYLRPGFLLHDIGKWMVPREIIQKPGKLTETEWAMMRTHPVAGAQMVSDIPFLARAAVDVIRSHHERWDGQGYPYKLKGEAIPVGARVFAVADVFDALTSDRPYRAAMSVKEASDLIRSERGTHFDPDVVDAFLEVVADVIAGGGPDAP